MLKEADSLKTLQSTDCEKVLEDNSLKTLQSTDCEKVLEDNSLKTLQSTDCEKVLKEVNSLKTLQSTDCEKVLEETDNHYTSSSGDESADLRHIQRELVDCTAVMCLSSSTFGFRGLQAASDTPCEECRALGRRPMVSLGFGNSSRILYVRAFAL
ncbi:hypothetical protein D5F01_LYC14902 [Larimichthys crocea]|uniref:Uncharacterized protein n=1 Tax=Larimichthys crocea TaxID=215358 RepID=A0A6G0I649_LARCR|nr:hypothetical protein D5F01_LYC14902 [Larimichthys crocea]